MPDIYLYAADIVIRKEMGWWLIYINICDNQIVTYFLHFLIKKQISDG